MHNMLVGDSDGLEGWAFIKPGAAGAVACSKGAFCPRGSRGLGYGDVVIACSAYRASDEEALCSCVESTLCIPKACRQNPKPP